ncbi:hypothetical protein BTUL_0056g00380 [Botrytis tulipae]|uniref:Uncharacterized protein n=1 Tax=Botrytis tulipae TaxID=87230 RepID=A0A4Z1ES33_9HELO|nr:hypothetical protein BTUL_0056g00380 [Botrytis tulipae]
MDGSGFSFLVIQGDDADDADDDDDDDDDKTIKTQWIDCTILYSLNIVDADMSFLLWEEDGIRIICNVQGRN